MLCGAGGSGGGAGSGKLNTLFRPAQNLISKVCEQDLIYHVVHSSVNYQSTPRSMPTSACSYLEGTCAVTSHSVQAADITGSPHNRLQQAMLAHHLSQFAAVVPQVVRRRSTSSIPTSGGVPHPGDLRLSARGHMSDDAESVDKEVEAVQQQHGMVPHVTSPNSSLSQTPGSSAACSRVSATRELQCMMHASQYACKCCAVCWGQAVKTSLKMSWPAYVSPCGGSLSRTHAGAMSLYVCAVSPACCC